VKHVDYVFVVTVYKHAHYFVQHIAVCSVYGVVSN